MSSGNDCLSKLNEHQRETTLLSSIYALLNWDERTGLPTQAGDYRAEQIAYLSGKIHQRNTAKEYGDWLETLHADTDFMADPHQPHAANVRVLRRLYQRQVKVPQSLVEELSRQSVVGQQTWAAARAKDAFADFQPVLEKLVVLKQQQADCLGHEGCRYDPLLDEFEPGASTAEVAEALAGLREALVPILQAIADSGRRTPADILRREFSVNGQRELSRIAAETVGFDFERGRLDTTTHPFCTELGPNDVRILTRFNTRNLGESFFGTLHEAGHGMYEQGLPPRWYGLPAGQFASLGIHESQSRLWENQVGRSQPFWKHFLPLAQSLFAPTLDDVSPEQIYCAANEVCPSLIRVEADEATYNLHIVIRFELEQALLNEDLKCADLPAAWNDKYTEYLGVTPDTDREGVLQDVHWGAGLFGYFPTYSLGNLYGAQMFEAAQKQLSDLDAQFARGEFQPLREWLIENVYRHGSCYTAAQLIESISGRPLDHAALIDYLRAKLGPIYGLD